VSSTEVTDLIDALRSGSMTLEEVAQRFRQRAWSRTRQPEPQSYEQLAAANLLDPEPLVPGSIDEVTAAYDRGDLTAEQYDVLSEAVADAINAAES
jgi:hypothetical protein